MEELNPTRSPTKRRIHKIESAWDWRNRVLKSMRAQNELYDWEWLFKRRYLTPQEKYAFYKFYFDGLWTQNTRRAIIKVDRNFGRMFVYW